MHLYWICLTTAWLCRAVTHLPNCLTLLKLYHHYNEIAIVQNDTFRGLNQLHDLGHIDITYLWFQLHRHCQRDLFMFIWQNSDSILQCHKVSLYEQVKCIAYRVYWKQQRAVIPGLAEHKLSLFEQKQCLLLPSTSTVSGGDVIIGFDLSANAVTLVPKASLAQMQGVGVILEGPLSSVWSLPVAIPTMAVNSIRDMPCSAAWCPKMASIYDMP